jgi:hypothetical protein
MPFLTGMVLMTHSASRSLMKNSISPVLRLSAIFSWIFFIARPCFMVGAEVCISWM